MTDFPDRPETPFERQCREQLEAMEPCAHATGYECACCLARFCWTCDQPAPECDQIKTVGRACPEHRPDYIMGRCEFGHARASAAQDRGRDEGGRRDG